MVTERLVKYEKANSSFLCSKKCYNFIDIVQLVTLITDLQFNRIDFMAVNIIDTFTEFGYLNFNATKEERDKKNSMNVQLHLAKMSPICCNTTAFH